MTVKFFSQFIDATGCREFELIAPESIEKLIEILITQFGEPMRQVLLSPAGDTIHEDAFLLVNGRHLRALNGFATQLVESDIVSVLQITEAG
ncbi:MAG: hypothetical protein PHC86_09415 [Eubacteriales bacterium]|nr:hypothetical protein [Eubacteriales bacterium]